MAEQTFNQKVEKAVENWEQRVEAASNHLDKTVNRAWNSGRLFRCVSRGTSLAAGRLANRGHCTAAAWCAGLGAAGLVADTLTAICFWGKVT